MWVRSNLRNDNQKRHCSGARTGGPSDRSASDWTDREVVDRKVSGRDGLFDVVRRITDHSVRPQEISRRVRGHVILAEVNTVSANGKRHVNSIVDDQLHAPLHSDIHSRLRLLIELTGSHPLLTKLNQRSAAVTQQLNLLNMRKP